MIYSYDQPPFDDSAIRAVDFLVDRVLERAQPFRVELLLNLGLPRYLMEHRMVAISMPRQSGKSTYLKKIFEKYTKSAIVFPSLTMARHSLNYARHASFHDVFVASRRDQVKILMHGSCKFFAPYEYVLFDEVKTQDVLSTLQSFADNKLINPETLVISLRTPTT